MSVDAKKFKGLIEEIEASEKRSKSEAEHRAAIFKRAKGDGLNPKLMRVIVRERRRNESERQKEQDELDTYRAALNAAVALVHNEGLSQREAARRSGVSKSSLNRALAVPAVSHDPETGEITDTAKAAASNSETHAEQPRAGRMPDAEVSAPNSGTHSETADRKPPGDSSERDGEGSSSGAAIATPSTIPQGEVDAGTGAIAEGRPANEGMGSLQGDGGLREHAEVGDGETAHGRLAVGGIRKGVGSNGHEDLAGVAPGPQDPWTPPPFLDRRKVAA